jgi:hypothetical protein
MNDTSREPGPVVVPEVVVSEESVRAGSEEILASNTFVVRALAAALLRPVEIAPSALQAASVGYYLAQLENGGFAQFAYNSGLDPELVERIRSGFEAMGAPGHAERLRRSLAAFERLTDAEQDTFFDGEFFGDNTVRDALNAADEAASSELPNLDDVDRVTERTAAWLLSLPELHVLPVSELEAFVSSRAELVADLDDRRRAAEADADANMPHFERAIRALCDEVGARFERITLGDPVHPFAGAETLGWHFLSDGGHHVMVESGDEAVMLDADRGVELARISLSGLG